VERIVSGPGLHDLYRFFGGRFFEVGDAAALWTAALERRDPAAEQALDLFIKTFGSAAGDLALARGSNAVVISSGLSQRLEAMLRSPLFVGRFLAKGRYRQRMERLPVRLAMHPEPGLLGAAVAFAREHGAAV
jgi:glucokinase